MIMPRERITGTCTQCGKEKTLFDTKNKICGSCMGKQGGGRPKALLPRPKIDEPHQVSPEPPSVPPKADPYERADPGIVQYLCDICAKPQYYGQRKCRCGAFNDWRKTEVESDPDIVVCPDCGAVCGHADQEITACPRCNGGS